MHSFHLLSFLLGFLLLSCSPSQAKHLYGHEKPHIRSQHVDDPTFKRDTNTVFTYFVDGQGACGATSSPNDFIVALSAAEYEGGTHCFEMITITINGKTTQAQIVDECSGCSPGGLDFSQGLFEFFAPLSEGELQGSWSYSSSNGVVSSSSTPSTSTVYYTPTSSTAMATTAAMTTPFTASSSTASPVSPITSTISSVPTIVPSTTFTAPPQDPQIFTQVNFALLELGSLLESSLNLQT